MRIMGIDYGDRRIGISVSDMMGWTAQGIESIEWKDNLNDVFDRIKQLIEEYNIEKLVVGFPKNMNGTVGPRGQKTLEFVNSLEESTGLQVIRWDERLTTVAANRAMQQMGVKKYKKKGIVDQIAAVFILQAYLDSIN